jgi:hypothetical protein
MLFFDAVTLPKAVPRDGSCLRTANSMDIWNNAVAFLRAALRRTTRTLFSFQGAAVLFSLKEGKPETHGLKPTRNPPNRLGSNPAACGGFRSVKTCGLACHDEVASSVEGRGRSCRSDQEPSLTIRSVVGSQPVTNG